HVSPFGGERTRVLCAQLRPGRFGDGSSRSSARRPITSLAMLKSDARPVHTYIGQALGTDYFLLRGTLTESELASLERTRRSVHEEGLPVINSYWGGAGLPLALGRRIGQPGLVGDGIEGYGCPPMSATAAGLVNMELNRGDGSLGTFLGVQA